jgi:hypothetical protein
MGAAHSHMPGVARCAWQPQEIGDGLRRSGGGMCAGVRAAGIGGTGRGLHSYTSQFNLSRSRH